MNVQKNTGYVPHHRSTGKAYIISGSRTRQKAMSVYKGMFFILPVSILFSQTVFE